MRRGFVQFLECRSLLWAESPVTSGTSGEWLRGRGATCIPWVWSPKDALIMRGSDTVLTDKESSLTDFLEMVLDLLVPFQLESNIM